MGEIGLVFLMFLIGLEFDFAHLRMMNTRALMGLIAINVGRELGVIPSSVFSMLVIMALVTTIMTMPLLRRLMPGTELDRRA